MAKTELPHHHGEEKMNTAEIREVLERVDNFQTIADVFRQLGDTTRVRIFWLLCHCDECVVNIAVMLDMSSPAVSHHLRTLRDSGLIVSRREGKEVYYHAADSAQSRLLHEMIEQVWTSRARSGARRRSDARGGNFFGRAGILPLAAG